MSPITTITATAAIHPHHRRRLHHPLFFFFFIIFFFFLSVPILLLERLLIPATLAKEIICGTERCDSAKTVLRQCALNPFQRKCDWTSNTVCTLGGVPGKNNSLNKDKEEDKDDKWQNVKLTSKNACKRIVCYFPSWAHYRAQGLTRQEPKDINPRLCTHIIYAFANLTDEGILGYSDPRDTEFLYAFNDMQRSNPDLKILLAVGGWTMGVRPFTKMARTKETRAKFIAHAIAFLKVHKLDGLDLDWEYPADVNKGSPPEDKHRFTALVKELREAFDATTGKSKLLLTAAVGSGIDRIDTSYDVAELDKNLDFINLMSYDLKGGWDKKTGHHSQLRGVRGDGRTIKAGADYWVSKGGSKEKLTIGLAFYARTFTLNNPCVNGVGAAAESGRPSPFLGANGILAYYEVCEVLKRPTAKKALAYDKDSPYVVDGNQWVGYDDQGSVMRKVAFARKAGYGGVLAWDISMDDVHGRFCQKGPYPLLSSMKIVCYYQPMTGG